MVLWIRDDCTQPKGLSNGLIGNQELTLLPKQLPYGGNCLDLSYHLCNKSETFDELQPSHWKDIIKISVRHQAKGFFITMESTVSDREQESL